MNRDVPGSEHRQRHECPLRSQDRINGQRRVFVLPLLLVQVLLPLLRHLGVVVQKLLAGELGARLVLERDGVEAAGPVAPQRVRQQFDIVVAGITIARLLEPTARKGSSKRQR